MAAKWTDSVTDAEWEKWLKSARRAALPILEGTSLGGEEYASRAIEKLLLEEKRPVNIEAWLNLVINRMSIDRFRKIGKFERLDIDNFSEVDFEQNAFIKFSGLSLSSQVAQRIDVERVLSGLNSQEYQLIMLSDLGFSNEEIADVLGYKSEKVVAVRIVQVKKKIVATIGENPLKHR